MSFKESIEKYYLENIQTEEVFYAVYNQLN